MRLHTRGVSAVIGTSVALMAAVVLALPRDADRGARHSAVRFTRGAVQRLDWTESPAHVAEDPEAVLVVASEGLGDFAVAAPPGDGGRHAAVTSAPPALLFGDTPVTVRIVAPVEVRPFSRLVRPVRGRAPPTL